MTREFVATIDKLIEDERIPVVHFERRQRKEAIAEPCFADAVRIGRSLRTWPASSG